MILWYHCNSCMKEFSYVSTGENDAKRCVLCRSDDIKRIVRKKRYRRFRK
jgi:hypothetical protein